MGVKVTFLREADAAAAPAAQPVTLVPQGRGARPRTAASYVFVVRGRTPSSAAPCRPAAPTAIGSKSSAGLSGGDRVVVSPPPELAEGTLIVVK